MSMKTCTERFYKIQIRSGHHESSKKKVARYVDGLKFNVQDELNMLKLSLVEDAQWYALKVGEKLGRKQGKKVTKVDKGKKLVSKKIICFQR